MSKSNLLLLGGYMHSGTTLMHEILSKHKSILSGLKESKILEWESAWQQDYDKERDKLIFLLNNILKGSLETTDFVPSGDSVVQDFFDLMEYESSKSNFSYYLEGSPNSYIWLDKIPSGSNYKMILVTRDPRDILASIKKRIKSKNFGNASNFRGRITNYYSLIIYATSIKSSFNKLLNLENQSQIILIDYFNITNNYPHTINLISEFLLVDKKDFPLENEISTRNTADKNAVVNDGLYYSSNYKKVLSKFEIVIMDYLFKDYFTKTGNLKFNPIFKGQLYYYLLFLKAPFDLLIFTIARFIRYPSWNRFMSYIKTSVKRIFN